MALIKRAEHRSFHRVLGSVTLTLYESENDHALVLFYGDRVSRRDVLVRIQTACTYGDALSISECDCQQQLEDTFGRFLENRQGVLIYLLSPGYGAGLRVQAEACQVSRDQSVDIVAAYGRLGVAPAEHTYPLVVEILRDIGTDAVALLTNNQHKAAAIEAAGFAVALEQMPVRPTVDNLAFLEAKQTRLNQSLGLTPSGDDRSGSRRCFVIGAAVMDHVFEVRHSPSIGRARQAARYRRRPGGKAFNQAVALSRLGANATLLTVRGNDADSAEVSNVLAMERVRDVHVKMPEGLRTPQTVVLQPPAGSSTYVGWLGAEHRILRKHAIVQHQTEIEGSHAVLVTLEASEDAVDLTVRLARANALVLLNASPIAEAPYDLSTDTLEHTDVLVGTKDELTALIPPRHRRRAPDASDEFEVAYTLARLCRNTVILTDFRATRPWVLAVNHVVETPVRVYAGEVRRSRGSDAIGATDAFCAALALRMLDLPDAMELPRRTGVWRDEASPLAKRTNLVDAIMLALGAEAYVARSRGGYKEFPRQDIEFEQWCRDHRPDPEPTDVTAQAFDRRTGEG